MRAIRAQQSLIVVQYVTTARRLIISLNLKIYRPTELVLNWQWYVSTSSLPLTLSSLIKHTHTHSHTFPSCFRCCILLNGLFLKKHADTASLWAALTWRRLVSKVEHVCISPSLWSSSVSTFLKVCSCHLTPPHYFLCSPACVCVCLSAGGQRLWPFCPPLCHTSCELPKECKADPFENYGRFQKVITGDEHLKWRATKIPQ